jgi:hypothetical protein
MCGKERGLQYRVGTASFVTTSITGLGNQNPSATFFPGSQGRGGVCFQGVQECGWHKGSNLAQLSLAFCAHSIWGILQDTCLL